MSASVAISSLVIFCFTMSVLLEVAGSAARPAGAILGKNALGYTLLVMINTVKRTFLVVYPPLLGIIALREGPSAVVVTIFLCFSVAIFPLVLVTLARKRLIIACGCFISFYSERGNIIQAIFKALQTFMSRNPERDADALILESKPGINISFFEFDKRVLILATIIQVFYTITLFAINLIGAYCAPYGPVVYQLTGLVSAVGTLIWAFALDPQLSRTFDKGADVARTFHSLLWANWACNIVLAPLFLWLMLEVLWRFSAPICGLQTQ